ncbi:MAG: DUF3883 domain-containing protein [Alphaproteobacteria bacterium]
MAAHDWNDTENDLIVADYFAMLSAELKGERYVKAAHRRALMRHLNRSDGSIEFKHQNISAVLQSLGETWIDGYKPAFNFQDSLVDAVERWFSANPAWIERPAITPPVTGLAEAASIAIEAPPHYSNQLPPKDLDRMLAVARRFNVAERDAKNRALGQAGERFALDWERQNLRTNGRDDLAREVIWVSRDEGDGAGFDIQSYEPDGSSRLVEVKTTNGWQRTPFHISRNELAVADQNREDWVLLRLFNFNRAPRAFELRPPLDHHVDLTPTNFSASFDQA